MRGRVAFAAAVFAVGAIPLAGPALRGPRGPRCALDGVTLVGAPAVRIETGDAARAPTFCCVGCAEKWVSALAVRPHTVLVTDETTGNLVPASQAWFVRSRVASQPATSDHVHAFSLREEAERHAAAYRGTILNGPARPFAEEPREVR